MTLLSQSLQGPATGREPRIADRAAPRAARLRPSPQQSALVGLAVLIFFNPTLWHSPLAGLWFAPAGIAIVLVAWLGLRAGFLAALASLFVLALTHALGRPELWGTPLGPFSPLFLLDPVLAGGEAVLAWWLYRKSQGDRRLSDPRSATVFLLLVPVLVTGTFAALRAAVLYQGGLVETGFGLLLGRIWLERALGVLTLAPALLVVLTPPLARRGWINPELPDEPHGDPNLVRLPGRRDWIEVVLLALGTGLYGSLLVLAYGRPSLANWQIWGVPLIFIVWAALRHGLPGGTIVSGAASILPLVVASFLWAPSTWAPMISCNLAAQCATALLVAASASWIRLGEARYRRVVGHIPMVLYSVRINSLPGPGRGHGAPASLDAEVTFVSPACRSMLGSHPEDLVGGYERWLAQVHPADREIVLAAVHQVSRQRSPVTCEYRLSEDLPHMPGDIPVSPFVQAVGSARVINLQAPTKVTRWVRDTLTPHVLPDGQLEGWEGVLTEITEQRVLADDLRRTTGMFHALVANLPAGVFFIQGQSGRPLLVNARARHLLGQREDASAPLSHLSAVYRLHRRDGTPYPPEELPVALALRRGLASMCDDIVVHRPDGRKVPLVTWAAPIDMTGQKTHDAAVWVLEDLTALRQAEAARSESETRLRAVVESMAEGLMVQDQGGRILECNPAATEILGLTADQLCGRSSFDPDWKCVDENGRPVPTEGHPAMISLRTGAPVRNRIIGMPTAAGPLRWLLVSAFPLPASSPATEKGAGGVVTTFIDITEYRTAVEGLRRSEEKHRGLVESLPLAVLQFEHGLRIGYMNPAAEAFLGCPLAEVRELPMWINLVHPDDRVALTSRLPCPYAGSGDCSGSAGTDVRSTSKLEVRFRARGGKDKVGLVLVGCGDVNGSPEPVTTALIVDVTRERELEHELLRAQRIELVGRLAGGIAHDFNNLLTVILSLAHMAGYKLPPDHEAHADLRSISDVATQAGQLAGQLLAFSKQRRVQPRRIEVIGVVRRTLDLLKCTLPGMITVEADLPAQELTILADDTGVQQVVMNLCLNARDAMPSGGRLTVRVSAEADGRWLNLVVADTGTGMTAEVLERIFDPFFSTKERGTGLGLAVVRQIAEGYGGRVEVWSEAGVGSRFTVRLPLAGGEG